MRRRTTTTKRKRRLPHRRAVAVVVPGPVEVRPRLQRPPILKRSNRCPHRLHHPCRIRTTLGEPCHPPVLRPAVPPPLPLPRYHPIHLLLQVPHATVVSIAPHRRVGMSNYLIRIPFGCDIVCSLHLLFVTAAGYMPMQSPMENGGAPGHLPSTLPRYSSLDMVSGHSLLRYVSTGRRLNVVCGEKERERDRQTERNRIRWTQKNKLQWHANSFVF
jgi:hypothetical protein